MTIHKATIKSFDSGAYTATVQIAGSLSTYLSGVKVARNIASGEMTAGRSCAVLFFDGGNPSDAVVIGVWT
jgi:hypothetical protein